MSNVVTIENEEQMGSEAVESGDKGAKNSLEINCE